MAINRMIDLTETKIFYPKGDVRLALRAHKDGQGRIYFDQVPSRIREKALLISKPSSLKE